MKAEWTNKDSLSIESTGQKAILVIDTPSCCEGCPCCQKQEDNWGDIAWAECYNGKSVYDYAEFGGRPDWCPLKPLPQKKEVNLPNGRVWSKDEIMAYTHGISVGYNECLDDLGETE